MELNDSSKIIYTDASLVINNLRKQSYIDMTGKKIKYLYFIFAETTKI